MPRETTFGIEAEWQTNAQAVCQRLFDQGLASSNHLHGWHCDCEDCELGNGFPFRGQTDSSCSGEIISDVFNTDEPQLWTPHIEALCQAAIDVDAEPGQNAGLHVHVGSNGFDVRDRRRAIWQVLKWEPVLERIAAGRWTGQRQMNRAVRSELWHPFLQYTGYELSNQTLAQVEEELDPDTLGSVKSRLEQELTVCDRHSNLNTNQSHHPTWEWRFWNSTRSAWRIGMCADVSRAFMDPEFLDIIENKTAPLRMRNASTGFTTLASALDEAGYGEAAEHILRQGNYLDNVAGAAPTQLTAV